MQTSRGYGVAWPVPLIPVGIYISPSQDEPPAPSEWITVDESSRYLGSPQWSPDGNLLYFLSEQGGHFDAWARALDPVTRRPKGNAISVFHLQHGPFFMNNPRGNATLRVTPDRLKFLLSEVTGNIYMVRPAP